MKQGTLTLAPPSGGVFVFVVVVVIEKIKQNGALALGAFRIILREHHVHEAARATYKHHGGSFRAVRVSGVVLLVELRGDT